MDEALPTADKGKDVRAKDRNCPFCDQAFTSSSLGRHLDLYIKPKNPKPADGIHVVEEIRRIRRNITRRQIRSAHSTKNAVRRAASISTAMTSKPASPTMTADPPTPVKPKLNGVINGLPPGPGSATPEPELQRDLSRQQQWKVELPKMTEEREHAEAVEMALKEVLNNINAAQTSKTLDDNLYALNFPGICLELLLPSPTLFTTTPLQGEDSWTIGPPGQDQITALQRRIHARAGSLQQRQKHRSGGPDAGIPSSPNATEDVQKLLNRVQQTYGRWMILSPQERQEYWQLEILRALSKGKVASRDMQARLDEARSEISRLWAQLSARNGQNPDKVHSYQLPVLPPLSAEQLSILPDKSGDPRWDFDNFVEKRGFWVSARRKSKGHMGDQKHSLSAGVASADAGVKKPPWLPQRDPCISDSSSSTQPNGFTINRSSGDHSHNSIDLHLSQDMSDDADEIAHIDAYGTGGGEDHTTPQNAHFRSPNRQKPNTYLPWQFAAKTADDVATRRGATPPHGMSIDVDTTGAAATGTKQDFGGVSERMIMMFYPGRRRASVPAPERACFL